MACKMRLSISHDPYLDGSKFHWKEILVLLTVLCIWGSGAWVGSKAGQSIGIKQGRQQLEIELASGELHPAMIRAFPQWFSGLKDSVMARDIICGKDYRRK